MKNLSGHDSTSPMSVMANRRHQKFSMPAVTSRPRRTMTATPIRKVGAVAGFSGRSITSPHEQAPARFQHHGSFV